jgi:hypothetical protein
MIINYIIGTYFGHRRMEIVNGLHLFELHLKQLLKLKHNIQKVYIAVPEKNFTEEIYKIIEKYPEIKTEVVIT